MPNQVRAIRIDLNMSQAELATATGIERSKVSKIETGKRKISATEALYLSEALRTSPEQLLGQREGVVARYRGAAPEEAKMTAAAFHHFVDDALFIDRTAQRYGVE